MNCVSAAEVNCRPATVARVAALISVGVLGLVGVALVLVATSRYGVGLSPDSTVYVSVARNVLAGRGWVSSDGSLYTQCPPLFPLLLAAIGLAGIDPAVGARFLNAAAFGGIVLASGVFFARGLRSRALAVVATAWVVSSFGLLGVCAMAWTEPVFVLLILLFILQMSAFLRNRRGTSLVAVSVLASLCLLTRYPGVAVIAPGLILLLATPCDCGIRSRLRQAGVFVAIACTPLGLYCVRNYLRTGMLTGCPRLPSIYSIGENVTTTARVITHWFLGSDVPVPLQTPILVALLLLATGALLLVPRRVADGTRHDSLSGWFPGLVILSYLPLMLYTHQVGVPEEVMNDRYLAPLPVLLLWFLFVGIDRLVTLLGQARGRAGWLQYAVIGASVLWLAAYPLGATKRTVREMARFGAGGYSSNAWHGSPLVQWLREHRLEGPVRSNVPGALYALLGISGGITPFRAWNLSEFQTFVRSHGGEYFVWFDNQMCSYLYDFEDLVSGLFLEEVATLPDGRVCRLPPEVDAVFAGSRIFSPYLVNGFWHSRFSDEGSDAGGAISSWILRTDGTTDSDWQLSTTDGTTIDWHARGTYTRSQGGFELHCDGSATAKKDGATGPYRLDVQGTVAEEVATGTYCVRWENPRWPAVSRGSWRVDLACPVYRMYSRSVGTHFYTMEVREVAQRSRRPEGWANEGIVFYAYPPGRQPPGTQPVYRFGAIGREAQFFTMDEAEKGRLLHDAADTWRYEGIAFYAYPPESHPATSRPVCRYWSPATRSHFYTISEGEKEALAGNSGWMYEAVAWYALAEKPR